MSADFTTAYLWVSIKRQHPTLRFEDVQALDTSQFEPDFEDDEDESEGERSAADPTDDAGDEALDSTPTPSSASDSSTSSD